MTNLRILICCSSFQDILAHFLKENMPRGMFNKNQLLITYFKFLSREIETHDTKSNFYIGNATEAFIDIYNPKLPISKLEFVKESLKNELDKVKQECLTKAVNTKNKSHVMFIDSSELEVGLRDIIT
ncbi:hypothetical protein CWI39_1443p0010, partial [Hamiltosporidium magnivora]